MSNQIIIDNKHNKDVIEFVESTTGIKLLGYQKEILRKYKCLPENVKIIFGKGGRIMVVESVKKEQN